jgi:uncharacterized protein DUF397
VADFQRPSIVWHKSTKSAAANCVEVAAVDGSILVRDSVNPRGLMLRFPSAAWSAFLAQTRDKDFRRA